MTAVPVALDARVRWRRRLPRWCLRASVTLALAVALTASAGLAQEPQPAVPPAVVPDAATEPVTPAAVPPASANPNRGDPDMPAVDLWATGVNATGAVLMTPLFPGWGQLYAGGGWRAALAFGTEMYFWTNLLTRDRQARRDLDYAASLAETDGNRALAEAMAAEHKAQMGDFVWWSGGALLIIALDAYVGAHLFNFDKDPVPVPDRWQDVFGPVGAGPASAAGSGPEVTVFQWRKGF